MKLKYIANQLTPDGLDEFQRVLLAYKLGQHVALSGPPGVGKTDLVIQLPRIVGRPLFEITCDSYMTEAPLVDFPELSGHNGSTVTKWESGVAAEENGIFYLPGM